VYTANKCLSPLIPEGADVQDPFFPRFWTNRIQDPYTVPRHYQSKNPFIPPGTAMIFAIDMGDIFSPYIPATWIWELIDIMEECPQIFQVLTKFPDDLLHWTQAHGLPDNVWVGVTVCNQSMVESAVSCLSSIDAVVKYICVEPLQEKIDLDLDGIDWVIIGAQTNPLILPEKAWVEDLLKEASTHNTPVFLKKSLQWHKDIHQWPNPQKKEEKAVQCQQ
jgi:protein gp37